MQTPPAVIAQFKHLALLLVASSSLLISGYIINSDRNWLELLVLLWCNFCGIILVYAINGYVDHSDAKFSLKGFLRERWHIIFIVQLFLFTFPIAFLTISTFRFIAFALIAATCIIYTISIRRNEQHFRMKNVFLFKNISIGPAWGALVLTGAGDLKNPVITALFIFASTQVFIGSMIRDIPDVENDRAAGLRTFPVLFGLNKSIFFMHFLNFCSIAAAFFCEWSEPVIVIFLSCILWRFINLWKLKNNAGSKMWGQTVNLATCSVILVLVIIQFLNDYFAKH
jgi:4-hydroxybenzoate polyprenyltransferase